ncbi:MAG TPA: DUF4105 domain-containing protein [Steroidobacteraceae bacterium]|nr:DUF4105 domain-containing protein [Steroidobacteraceae bacterium]
MTINASSILRLSATLLATLIVACSAIWGAFALWYQVPGGHPWKTLSVLLWSGISVGLLISMWQGRAAVGFLAFAVAFAALLIWWQRIAPSNDRIWADDVAQMLTGTVQGTKITLHNVRNFEWRSDTDYTLRWETRDYDLDRLNSLDMIMSYWNGPDIAHMIISFGFDNGEHVAFSVEIRRRQRQNFSEIGGFFKEFTLSIIAADERDVIRVRTNVRGEDAYLYRIRMPVPAIRSLFEAYIDQANALVRTPRFYNTITVNCTTLVYHMMKRIVGYLPLDYRLLFTGHLPEYVYSVGGLDDRYAFSDLRALGRITARAIQADRSGSFSADIRQGIPQAPAADARAPAR